MMNILKIIINIKKYFPKFRSKGVVMEDIKIIQEKMDIIESLCTDDCINKSVVIRPLKQAIENLIARNKELESALNNSVSKDEIKAKRLDFNKLYDWYVMSIEDTEPIWTEEHIEELLNDFIIIPKELLNKGE